MMQRMRCPLSQQIFTFFSMALRLKNEQFCQFTHGSIEKHRALDFCETAALNSFHTETHAAIKTRQSVLGAGLAELTAKTIVFRNHRGSEMGKPF